MQASPITITVTVTILASGCSVHAARAQQAPSVAASSPTNPIDPLEGKVVREIRISPGLRPSTEDIVRRHLASRQGVSFHHATLVEDRRRLDALRLFSSVEIKPVAAGDEVVLEVDVKETLRLLPLIALSVTDENGVSAGPAFKGINLFGRGTLSSGTAQFGGTTTVSARVERPTVTPGMWALDARTVYRSRRNELFDFDETSTTIEASGGWNWTSRMQVGGRAEFVWFDTGSAEIALSPSGTDHLPAVGLFVTYNSLDPLSNPRVGWFGSVDIARQFGDARSWTLTLDGRRLQPLSARSTLSLVAFAESHPASLDATCRSTISSGLAGRTGYEAGRWDRASARIRRSRRSIPVPRLCPSGHSPCSGATFTAAFKPPGSATSVWRGPTVSQPPMRSMAMVSACGCWFPSSTLSGWIWLLGNPGAVPLRGRHQAQGG